MAPHGSARPRSTVTTERARGQGWILDTFLNLAGLDVLHPEARGAFEALGYDHNDLEIVGSLATSRASLPKAWASTASRVEKRAQFYEMSGFGITAVDLYLRAALLWGRAQYSFFADDPRKATFSERAQACLEAVSRLSTTSVERVELAFDGGTLCGLLHLPPSRNRVPAVILCPGMDMIKEDYTVVVQRYYLSRGLAALAIDGPGQGETRRNGVVVDVENYERAVSAFVTSLTERPEVDSERIALWGVSMGSYWGMRAAAKERRLRAVATALGCYGDMDILFNRTQPSFKVNFMYMAGYDDEASFDAEVGSRMGLADLAGEMACPTLMMQGEFDELSRVEDALALYGRIPKPKELVIFEDEFHTMGGVYNEILRYGAEWIERALGGAFDGNWAETRYVTRRGDVNAESAVPPWWLGAVDGESSEPQSE